MKIINYFANEQSKWILRRKCEPVDIEFVRSRQFKKIVKKMHKLMLANEGVGLSAPQIGINKRFFITRWDRNLINNVAPEPYRLFINPRIRAYPKFNVKEKLWEGCLSLPETSIKVERVFPREGDYYSFLSDKLVGTYFQEITHCFLSTENIYTRIFLHELDHLDGKLIIDYQK